MSKKKKKNICPNKEEGKCPSKSNNCPTSESFENSGGIITDTEYEITAETESVDIEKETNN